MRQIGVVKIIQIPERIAVFRSLVLIGTRSEITFQGGIINAPPVNTWLLRILKQYYYPAPKVKVEQCFTNLIKST